MAGAPVNDILHRCIDLFVTGNRRLADLHRGKGVRGQADVAGRLNPWPAISPGRQPLSADTPISGARMAA